ncbi:pilus assembly protein PilM [Pseudomonas sp. 148P]|uniref:Pilus assembly protein PilM n=1 Tax=Pseudomonas ulcerans TaxID=3115852 RepID=A0ABU7HME7_9PSED|nr:MULTISPECIES: pilus assembly protein PilM [unclassified Pseudomonas]MEE1921739.1 pilus assembly protein PilM [Pseudomonas sp. 147P]MEE1932702.1 pilus assembly protein PilM [Pseudomonas sp. 148P]
MFGRTGRDAGSLLGVEIASGAVRLLQLERRPSGLGLRGWAIEALPPGALADGRIVAHEGVAEALRRALARSGASAREAALAVPAAAVIQHSVAMPPGLDDEEIDERLRDEAEQFIPFAVEEAALDYRVVPGTPGMLNVAFSACRQEWLDSLERVMGLAGLRARIVDIDSHAWQRVLARQAPGLSALVLVEVDYWVFHGFRMDGSLSFSERQLPREPVLEELADFVDQCLLREPGAMPDQLWLAGVDAGREGLAEHLQQRLGIATRPFDPLAGLLASQQDHEGLDQAAPLLGVACGLALRGYC